MTRFSFTFDVIMKFVILISMSEKKISKIFLMGPQGSGKGTQAEMLSKKMGIPALSMGQLLREEIDAKTDIGLEIVSILHVGNLVPDVIAAKLLQKRLQKSDTQHGYILDGFPRNRSQFNAFSFDVPTHVIVISITEEESLRRLHGRLTCLSCGRVSHVNQGKKMNDPCVCGGVYTIRDDDTEEAIMRRLAIYYHDTIPIIEEYKKQGLVRSIDGGGSIEEVFERIFEAL